MESGRRARLSSVGGVVGPASSPPRAFSDDEAEESPRRRRVSSDGRSDETVENLEMNKIRGTPRGPLAVIKEDANMPTSPVHRQPLSSLHHTFWAENECDDNSPLDLDLTPVENIVPTPLRDGQRSPSVDSALNTTASEDSAELVQAKSERDSEYYPDQNILDPAIHTASGRCASEVGSRSSSSPCQFLAEDVETYMVSAERQAALRGRPSHIELNDFEEMAKVAARSRRESLINQSSALNKSIESTVEVVGIGQHAKEAPPNMDSIVIGLKKEGRITEDEAAFLLTLIGTWHHDEVNQAFAGVVNRSTLPAEDVDNLQKELFEMEEIKAALEAEVMDLRAQLNSGSSHTVADLQEIWEEKMTRALEEVDELQELGDAQRKDLEAKDHIIHNVENRLAEAELQKGELTSELSQAKAFEIRLEGSEEDTRELRKKLDDVQMLLDKVSVNLRAKVEESARLKSELEIQRDNARSANASETHWKERVSSMEAEVQSLTEKLASQSTTDLVKESGEQFLERLSAQLKTDTEGSTVAKLTATIDELAAEQNQNQATIESLRHDVRQRDHDLERVRREHGVAIQEMQDNFMEQRRQANRAAMVSMDSNILDESLDLSIGPMQSIHSEYSHQESVVETACDAFDKLVSDRNTLFSRQRDVVAEVERLVESEKIDAHGKSAEIEAAQKELFALMEAQEGILGRLAAENKHLMRQMNHDKSSTNALSLLESHVAELRTLWQEELARNSEMRRVVMDNPPAIVAAAQQETSALRLKCERFESQLGGVANALRDQQRDWDSWLVRIDQMLAQHSTEFGALENPKERIEVTVKSVVEKMRKYHANNGNAQTMAVKASSLEEVGQNLVHQKRALLWISAFNGGCPPQVHHAGCVISGKNKLRAAAISVLVVTRLAKCHLSRAKEGTAGLLPVHGSRSPFPHVPRPRWQQTAPPSIHASLAAAALPKVEAALATKTSRIEELEGLLADMHVRLAEAEGRSQGAVKAKDSVVSTLMEERDRLTEALEREYAETRKVQQKWEERLQLVTKEQDEIVTRLDKERRSREAAESRVDKYRTRIRERESKYESFKSSCTSREEHYKAALAKLRNKLEMANSAMERQSCGGRGRRDDDDIEMIRKLLGKPTGTSNSKGKSGSNLTEKISSDLLERQTRLGVFMDNLIRSAEEDLEEIESTTAGNNVTVCEHLRDHIEGLKRANKRLRIFKR